MNTRREVLKMLVGSAVILALPDVPAFRLGGGIADDFSLNLVTKTISANPQAGSYTCLEFHRWLSELADDEEMMCEAAPTSRASDTLIRLDSNWFIEEDVPRHLYNGSLVTDEDIYSSFLDIEEI